ncbi:MAG TPA: hypothetical protein VEX60_18930 [Pyrinomonadaceae bacterium]|nr:hypothetical protein [Pyrinomonadaceae bacterium]
MPKNPEIPLHLYQVLEEEFISLHGPIPADEILIVELPGGEEGVGARPVEAARDWLFRGGHVKDAVGLASEILQFSDGAESRPAAAADTLAQDEWARKNLLEYLRGEIDRKILVQLVEGGAHAHDASQGTIEDALNRLLKDPDLYDGDRFAVNWLSAPTRGLVEQRDYAEGFYGDALAHFNRLLLEDAFPGHIERLSNIRIAAIYRRFHAVGRSALCLSGGGIRSGTFALGLMQGMARRNLLGEFDYLSTVSGGGYIGGWLTAWLHRHPGGLEGVTRDLSNEDPVSKIDPDPKALQYLRSYSNFLTPKAGMLTADTWAFIGIYLRNLSLNWLVFIPLLIAVLLIPRLIVTLTLLQPVENPKTLAATLAMSDDESERAVKELKEIPKASRVVYPPKTLVENFFGDGDKPEDKDDPENHLYYRHLLLLLGFAFGVWALGYVGFNRPGVREILRQRSRFWRTRADQRGFLKWCLLPLIVSAVLLTTYWAWSREAQTVPKSVVPFLLFGAAFTLFGWLIASLVLRRLFSRDEIRRNWLELLGLIFAGLIGGMLFWAVSFQEISDPVIGYGILVREYVEESFKWNVVRAPFPWTDVTSWSWWFWTTELYVCVGVPIFLLIFWGATTVFIGLSSYSRRIDDEDREWWARLGAWLLIASLAWVVFNAIVIFGPLALLESPKLIATVGGLSGLISILVGRSALSSASEKSGGEKEQTKSSIALGLLGGALPVLGAIFLAAFLSLLSLATTGITRGVAMLSDEAKGVTVGGRKLNVELLTNIPDEPSPIQSASPSPSPAPGFGEYVEYITPVIKPAPTPAPQPTTTPTPCTAMCPKPSELAAALEAEEEKKPDSFDGAKIVHMNVLHHTSLWLTLALLLIALILGLLLSRLINLNIFSLHGGYRNRMIRAFLGASRPRGARRPNPFTGFDPADNISMHELRPALLDEGDLLKPRKLAEALLDEKNPLSLFLLEAGKLENVRAEDSTLASESLINALRTDLNAILVDERLYALAKKEGAQETPEAAGRRAAALKFIEESVQSKRAKRIWRTILGSLGISAQIESGAAWLDDALAAKLSKTPIRSDYHILLNRLVLESAYPRLLKSCSFPPPPYKLMHVVNTTLNLVGGGNLAWQQRKAEPFSISPLHSGCFRLGYRKTRDYGGHDTGGVSVGTATAISGAAASSNMGYYTTSPVISLLLTLFNVRLGWWLGNPGPAGNDTYRLAAPKLSVAPVISEAFGLTDDRNKYVYLTDGGHFENLAVYEMVLRRCRIIVVSDGGADAEYNFTDLGNAVRKIRIDLGVPIDFPCVEIFDPETKDKAERERGMYWALGRIRYSCVDRVRRGDGPGGLAPDVLTANTPPPLTTFAPAQDGILLYIKPAIYGDEPRDVIEYKKSFPAFPHQSTGDQFFDEPQFESYRALGSFIMDKIFSEKMQPAPPPEGGRLPPQWMPTHQSREDLQSLLREAAKQWKEICSKEIEKDVGLMDWLDGWLEPQTDGE